MSILIQQIDPKNDAPAPLSKKEAKKKTIPLIGYGELEEQGFKVSDLAGKMN